MTAPATRVQGVVDEVPGLLTAFPGPLSAHTNRDKLAQLIAARSAAAGKETWCPQPEVLKVRYLSFPCNAVRRMPWVA